MKIKRQGHCVYAVAEGEISFSNAALLKEKIYDFLRPEDREVVLNISQVYFMDSAGLGFLISLIKKMKQRNGRFVVEYPQLGVQKLLEMLRMDELMEIKKTPEKKTGSWDEMI